MSEDYGAEVMRTAMSTLNNMVDASTKVMRITVDGVKLAFDVTKPIMKAAIVFLAFCVKGIYGKHNQTAAKKLLMNSSGIVPMALKSDEDFDKFSKIAKKMGLPFVYCKDKNTRLIAMRKEDSALINRIIQLTGISHLSDEEFEAQMLENKNTIDTIKENVKEKAQNLTEEKEEAKEKSETNEKVTANENGEISTANYIENVAPKNKIAEAKEKVEKSNPTQALSGNGQSEQGLDGHKASTQTISASDRNLALASGISLTAKTDNYLNKDVKVNKNGKKYEVADNRIDVKKTINKVKTKQKMQKEKSSNVVNMPKMPKSHGKGMSL